ncbi:MAG TPA: UbiD family decarboxylase [Nannocystaceae bacterium]|nr:UbiD family decarboxylase [Nannocystaceae bacterium]
MAYRSLAEAIDDLEHTGQLRRIDCELDPKLELAMVHLRVQAAGGPALLFTRVKGCAFPCASNLFGTHARARYLLRHGYERVLRAVELRADPSEALRHPLRHLGAPFAALRALPKHVADGPVLANATTISALPQIQCWPDDGGPFVTLPQVYTEHPDRPGPMQSNVGMYRVQLGGNDYERDREIGLHYQIHRGIGVHHTRARDRGEALRVSIFVGGPPAHTLAAVMPLPEGLTELTFAGMLAGRRFRWARHEDHVVSTEADFVMSGTVEPTTTKLEGPFGDHLGYYSLRHPFPVLRVDRVWHRDGAIWPFTVVGRPPQEDTIFGAMIHELTAKMVPRSIPGLVAMHAVDAAGVHPLMLALGSERYVPWGERRPQELLTIANAVLGFGQASLAKYLLIAAHEDAPALDLHDEGAFVQHVLARFDPRRDLHFHTRTTIDTLDYSGTGLNEGSKLVIAAAGAPLRELGRTLPERLPLPDGFADPRLALPGVIVLGGPRHEADPAAAPKLCAAWSAARVLDDVATPWPLVVLVDDPDEAAHTLRDLVWVAFTRSNPSHDVHGVGASTVHKHWGCTGALVIDARKKAHHAPPLVEDPAAVRRIEALAVAGGPLHGLW